MPHTVILRSQAQRQLAHEYIDKAPANAVVTIKEEARNLDQNARFEMGLDGQPFPVGFSSSRLSKREFADLITIVQEYGDRHGVAWSEPNPYETA